MSTAPISPPPPPPPAPRAPKDEITVISHSNILYWWPVWAVGFVLGFWSLAIDRYYMVTVPPKSEIYIQGRDVYTAAPGTQAFRTTTGGVVIAPSGSVYVASATVKDPGRKETKEDRDAIVLPSAGDKKESAKSKKGASAEEDTNAGGDNGVQTLTPIKPRVHMARTKSLGVIFCVTLLAVILITNLPYLRGGAAILIVIGVILVSVILVLAGAWEWIVGQVTLLDIRINAGGYFFISGILLGIWLLALLALDRYTYIVFTPREFRVSTPAAANTSTTRGAWCGRRTAARSATGFRGSAWWAIWWSRPRGPSRNTSTCPTSCSSARRCGRSRKCKSEPARCRTEPGGEPLARHLRDWG